MNTNKIPYQQIISCNFFQYCRRQPMIAILLLLLCCASFKDAKAQTDHNYVLAEKHFAAGEYLTAAGLYEQFLHPAVKQKTGSDFPLFANRHKAAGTGKAVDKADVLYKQAESYRLANYWVEAASRYKECFDRDEVKYAGALYWYAASQRSIGNFAEAEKSLQIFLENHAGNAHFKDLATNELATLKFIREQTARPDSVLFSIQQVSTGFGKEKGMYALASITGNQIIFTSTATDSIIKQGVNPYHNRLFTANWSDNVVQDMKALPIENLDPYMHQIAGSISHDDKYLYFTQWKTENGKANSAIYYAAKKENGWGQPVLLQQVNKENSNSKQPFCTSDGKYLFFSSDRAGGLGGYDIWYAALQTDGTAGEPVNMGPGLNSSSNEQSPFYHQLSGTLVFSSDRAPGMGGFDIFTSKGKEIEWETPVNLGHPVNSARDDLYFFTRQDKPLLEQAWVSSDRGSNCCLELFVVNKSPKNKRLNGTILDCRNNEPLAGAEVILKNEKGDSLVATTGTDGNYEFDLVRIANAKELFVRKSLYKESADNIAIASKDETGWLTDILMSKPICLEKKLVIKVENVVTVYFDFDKSMLKDRGIEQLDSIYAVLSNDSVATIQISGYTDGLGSEEYNKKLSDKRAKACADYLIGKGIDAARISFESFGACCPIEMELLNGRDNPDGRSKNRRALINISKE